MTYMSEPINHNTYFYFKDAQTYLILELLGDLNNDGLHYLT